MSEAGSELRVRSKIWLEIDGKPVFGRGRDELLRLIQKTGSISAAAKEMGVPYRKAWTYIDAMEKRLGFPLVERLRVRLNGLAHVCPGLDFHRYLNLVSFGNGALRSIVAIGASM